MDEAKRVEEGLAREAQTQLIKEDCEGDLCKKSDRNDGRDRVDNVLDQPVAEKAEAQPQVPQKSKRVATLDAFRGLTIVVILTPKTNICY